MIRLLLAFSLIFSATACHGQESLRDAALASRAKLTLRKGAEFYRGKVAVHGGYVYYTTLDLHERWGEGPALPDQIWVQPPATPSVGLAYLSAWKATGDEFFREAMVESATALIHGQLASGGWQNSIEFDAARSANRYRNGQSRGARNNSTLDDGITQSALLFLIRADGALEFRHAAIHEAASFGLNALLNAQFPNGGFPQIWTGPVDQSLPVKSASFPTYDWRTDGRVPDYWTLYTLNDGLAQSMLPTLQAAVEVYGDQRSREALVKLGDFLVLAQLPESQPGWAQQYTYAMHPAWARRFEPPAVSGAESQGVMETLIEISRLTGDKKYLQPIPAALAYFRKSQLPNGQLARYYEINTNRPLYMNRRGDQYSLTYSDVDLPDHYGWKWDSRLDQIGTEFQRAQRGVPAEIKSFSRIQQAARTACDALDEEGRWVSTYAGERLLGQPEFPLGAKFLASSLFCENMRALSEYLTAIRE